MAKKKHIEEEAMQGELPCNKDIEHDSSSHCNSCKFPHLQTNQCGHVFCELLEHRQLNYPGMSISKDV